jgi:muramoyltetrapeptide carboxypeptidase
MIQSDMQQPRFLNPGDKVALLAPARKVTPEEMAPAIAQLRSWGLDVVCAPNLYKNENQFSGSDAERAADLQGALDDDSIRAIFCARGGYGTVRVIDALRWDAFMKNPKWIVGYSDVTVLHSHIFTHCRVQTLHATMPINFAKDPHSTNALRRTLFGDPLNYTWNNITEVPNRSGKASGVLTGGNLSLLYALNNTPSDIDTAGTILFLEDLDEYLYHIDRILLNLDRSGKLKNLAGLIIGGMDDMKDNAIPFGKNAEQIIADAVKNYTFPVAYRFPAGHGTENYPLIFGNVVTLEVNGAEATLVQRG